MKIYEESIQLYYSCRPIAGLSGSEIALEWIQGRLQKMLLSESKYHQ